VRKNPDQRASQELREPLARQQAEEWAALIQSEPGKLATEAWAREHPTITAQSVPRFIFGMTFGTYVKRFVRKLAADRDSKA
jgi:hypothetical protein